VAAALFVSEVPVNTVIILNRDAMGQGDDALGRKILTTCLRKLVTFGDHLDAIVLYNGGVKLAAKDSPVAAEIRQLHDNGVEILACATCVEHFGLSDNLIVDRPSNMDEILSSMKAAEKVISL